MPIRLNSSGCSTGNGVWIENSKVKIKIKIRYIRSATTEIEMVRLLGQKNRHPTDKKIGGTETKRRSDTMKKV